MVVRDRTRNAAGRASGARVRIPPTPFMWLHQKMEPLAICACPYNKELIMKRIGKKEWDGPKKGFYGWYFKCQSEEDTVIFIASVTSGNGEPKANLQIANKDGVWNVEFPGDCFMRKGGNIFLSDNHFGKNGIVLDVTTADLRAKGKLYFKDFTPIEYDIMGPFVMVPFMECRHSIMSMKHKVNGNITINGKKYEFNDAFGYWEGDRGTSFPSEYLWTQTAFDEGSLMLSVAEIPMGNNKFTGVIGIIHYQGKEYRLATYKGAKVKYLKNRRICITQDDMIFEAKLYNQEGHSFTVPEDAEMNRTIRENLTSTAAYRFRVDGETLFAFKTDKASFEDEYK